MTILNKTKSPVRRWIFGAVLLSGVLGFHAPVCAQSLEEEMRDMSASGLLSQASRAMNAGRYEMAVPYLEKYIDRMIFVDDKRVKIMIQEVRLKLAKIFAHTGNPVGSVDYLEQYVDSLPVYKPREAYKLLTINLFEMNKYEECIEAATNALAEPPPRDLDDEVIAVDYDKEIDEEDVDTAGLTARQLRRLDKQEERLSENETLSSKFSSKQPDVEAEYTVDELVMLNLKLAESYTELNRMEESIEPYQFVIDNALQETTKGYAIMKMVQALVYLERFEEARSFVTQLYQTDARYDIRVNMALMSTATAFFNVGEYDSALQLYRMILPREDLVKYQEVRMNEIRRKAGLPDVQITITTNDTGMVRTMFGNKVSAMTASMTEQGQMVKYPPKPPELEEMEEAVSTLVGLQPYENDVLFFVGMVYSRVGRPWEAIAVFDEVMVREPNSDRADLVFAEKLSVLTDPLEEYEMVEDLAMEYLLVHTEGLGPRRVAHSLTICYQRRSMWKEIQALRPTLEGFVVSDNPDILRFDCELYFLQAIADMMLMQYAESKEHFAYVIDTFGEKAHQHESSVYWMAMCDLYLQNYEEALAEFDYYLEKYPEGMWLPSIRFHRGICFFGESRYDEAQEAFADVMATYPEESVYPDACSMHADILASIPDLDGAQRDYEEAIRVAEERYNAEGASESDRNNAVRQATYAVFQMSTMFDLNKRLDDILTKVNAYLEVFGDDADVAKAAFWKGKTLLAQDHEGHVEEAIDAYMNAIVTYGDDVMQAGVDDIISELGRTARYRLTDTQRFNLKNQLQEASDDAESVTLSLRLRVLLAELNDTTLTLGRQLIGEVEDLTQAPPPVLAVICKASFEDKDYSRAEEIMEIFTTRYEVSDFTGYAMKLRCYDLFDQQYYLEAMDIIKQAQALFGTAENAVWAQVMKGRVQIEQKLFDEAKLTFEDMLKTPEWRGEPCAMATYYLGALYEAHAAYAQEKGEASKAKELLGTAFGWYQRVYMQYKGYAKGHWAAEGYLASARCLQKYGMDPIHVKNTYRAMLYDRFVNTLPQADQAREALGAAEAQKIDMKVAEGAKTNLTVTIDVKKPEPAPETDPQVDAETDAEETE